jgi:hypothetical protein
VARRCSFFTSLSVVILNMQAGNESAAKQFLESAAQKTAGLNESLAKEYDKAQETSLQIKKTQQLISKEL